MTINTIAFAPKVTDVLDDIYRVDRRFPKVYHARVLNIRLLITKFDRIDKLELQDRDRDEFLSSYNELIAIRAT